MLSLSQLAVAATGLTAVMAIDARLQIQKPDCVSMQLFETAFFAACYGFPYARSGNTSYEGPAALFEPGDYQGKNNDTTALAYCTYFSPDGSQIHMTAGVAQLLGGNVTTPCDSTTNTCYFQYEADGSFVEGSTTVSPTFGYSYTSWGLAATATGGSMTAVAQNTMQPASTSQ